MRGYTSSEDIYDSEQKFRIKIIGKAFVKSIIAFLIGFVIVYVYFELILKVKDYGTNEVLIATGIPLSFWFITMVISTYPLYRKDKERFENLDNETKEKILKWKRPLYLLSIVMVILAFLQIPMALGFLSIPHYYRFIFFTLIFCILFVILILLMKYKKNLKM